MSNLDFLPLRNNKFLKKKKKTGKRIGLTICSIYIQPYIYLYYIVIHLFCKDVFDTCSHSDVSQSVSETNNIN